MKKLQKVGIDKIMAATNSALPVIGSWTREQAELDLEPEPQPQPQPQPQPEPQLELEPLVERDSSAVGISKVKDIVQDDDSSEEHDV